MSGFQNVARFWVAVSVRMRWASLLVGLAVLAMGACGIREENKNSTTSGNTSGVTMAPGPRTAPQTPRRAPPPRPWPEPGSKPMTFSPSGGVTGIAFGSRGRLLITGGRESLIKVWNARTHQFRYTIGSHRVFHGTSRVRYLGITARNSVLLTLSDGELKLWNLITKTPINMYSSIHAVAVARGRSWYVTGSGRQVRLWDARNRKVLAKLPSCHVHSLAADGKSNTIAVGCSFHGVELVAVDPPAKGAPAGQSWRLRKVRTLKQSRPGLVSEVAFRAGGKRLAMVESDQITLWDTTSGRRLHRIQGAPRALRRLVSAPDGKTLAAGGLDGAVRIYDWDQGRLQKQLPSGRGAVGALTFSPDSKRLLAGYLDRGQVVEWDPASGRKLRVLPAHHDGLGTAAMASRSRRVVATFGSSTRRDMLEIRQGRAHLITLPESAVVPLPKAAVGSTLAMHPSGGLIAMVNTHGSVLLINANTKQIVGHLVGPSTLAKAKPKATAAQAKQCVKLSTPYFGVKAPTLRARHEFPIARAKALAFSPDGKTLYVGMLAQRIPTGCVAAPQLVRWSVKDRRYLGPINPKIGSPESLLLSADGTRILVRVAEALQVYDTRTGKRLRKLDRTWYTAHAFSSDGKTVALGRAKGRFVHLFDVATGKKRRLKKIGRVHALLFSPDSRTLLVGDYYGTIRRVDVATGKVLGDVGDHHRTVLGMQISADGRVLMSTAIDGTVRLWPDPFKNQAK